MRKALSLIASLLTLVFIGLVAISIYNKDPGIKSAVDSMTAQAKSIVTQAVGNLTEQINETISGNSNGSDNYSLSDSKPALPLDIKITSSTNENDDQEAVSPVIAAEDIESLWGKTGVDGLSVYEYGKSLLNTDERKCYIQIADAVRDVKSSVTLSTKCNDTQLKKIYSYYVNDHAEVFYLDGVNLSYTGNGNTYKYEVSFEYGYSANKSKIISMRKSMGAKALTIVKSVSGLTTDLKKEKAIHDTLIKKCAYDTSALENPSKYPDSCSAYGALVNGKAICQGYAQAMKIMLSSAGIKSLYVTGTASGGSHAWNMVSIAGRWRYLDATFDDPVFVDENGNYTSYNTVSYTYFNYTSKSDHVLGHFVASDPFYKTSENYETMPTVVK